MASWREAATARLWQAVRSDGAGHPELRSVADQPEKVRALEKLQPRS